ncbi:unnamed protein product [Closterium sp. NIES-64]|nr:unnamed protein product [Closterium sp. NIES-64]
MHTLRVIDGGGQQEGLVRQPGDGETAQEGHASEVDEREVASNGKGLRGRGGECKERCSRLHLIKLGGIKLGGIQLGGIQLGGIQLGGIQLGGIQLGGIQLGGIQLGGIQLGGIQLGGIQLGGIQLGGPTKSAAFKTRKT